MPENWWEQLRSLLMRPILPIGSSGVSLGVLLQLIFLAALLFFLTSRTRRWLIRRLEAGTKLDASARQAVGSIFSYIALLAGFVLILQTVGIDMTGFSVLAGGLGIGLGFGLQNIANNLVSGLIVLLERPVKIGDRIEVAGTEGQVVEIRARGTIVLTNDNIAIIIPNSRFITEEVVNWSYSDPKVRFRVPVSVSYDSDVRLVEKVLLEVARGNADVLTDPPPVVRFLEFGDNGLQFELRAWSVTLVQRKGKLVSDLNFAILDAFRAHGIEIPFPQRDVRWKGTLPPGAGARGEE
ncbi:MAG: mechanosensitive ion channel [Bryobacterales bacterium]|nr:mechanosensitive ion channel [Bryobacterales bacterium]